MGSGSWTTDTYAARSAAKAAAGKPTFAHDDDVRRTGVIKVHDDLDPKMLNQAGVQIRESRDSDDHPESRAIAILFDETGSMGEVPRVLQQKLPKLHALLQRKGYVEHPHILFGCLGDAFTDKVPLQVGQFEADNRMDDNLENFYLEANGGGQMKESYELAMWFMSQFAAMDCLEKRGTKGYLFIIGDEKAYPSVRRDQVKEIVGVDIPEDISLQEVVARLREKFEVFFLMAPCDNYGAKDEIFAFWRDIFGERAVHLDDPDAVCETIALTIGLLEGIVDIDEGAEHLKEIGTDERTVANVSRALATVGAGASSVAKADGAIGVSDQPDTASTI